MTTAGDADDLAAAHKLVISLSPSARRTYAVGGTQKYELPMAEVTLSQVGPATSRKMLGVQERPAGACDCAKKLSVLA